MLVICPGILEPPLPRLQVYNSPYESLHLFLCPLLIFWLCLWFQLFHFIFLFFIDVSPYPYFLHSFFFGQFFISLEYMFCYHLCQELIYCHWPCTSFFILFDPVNLLYLWDYSLSFLGHLCSLAVLASSLSLAVLMGGFFSLSP